MEVPEVLRIVQGSPETLVVDVDERHLPVLAALVPKVLTFLSVNHCMAITFVELGVNLNGFVVVNPDRAPGGEPLYDVCLNPFITVDTRVGSCRSLEGCMQFPGKLFEVPRWKRVVLTWTPPVLGEDGTYKLGERVTRVLDDLWARAAQHLVDHLKGAPSVDKVGVLIESESRDQLLEAGRKAGLQLDSTMSLSELGIIREGGHE